MTKKKKTLYEILEVPQDATLAEIQASHRRLTEKIQSSGLKREDVDFKLKVINVALQTLSDRRSRDAYDAQIASIQVPALIPHDHALVPSPRADSMALQAEAMSLKAEAVSLKAEAVSLKAEAMSLKMSVPPYGAGAEPGGNQSGLKKWASLFGGLAPPVRKGIVMVASMIAMLAVFQMFFVVFANRQIVEAARVEDKASEKVIIQEFYQTYGVRVNSAAEAQLLEAEYRRKEREQSTAERESQRKEEEYKRFVEESRRMGEQVTYENNTAEERARHAEEQQKRREEQERLEREAAEREAEQRYIEEKRRKMGLE
ncbi:MAG: DnaJ domain-containing protein [Nitrosomonadales bacterium]|nr:DnaJ domain-containing protein [Nitrosomonadales bacterium]